MISLFQNSENSGYEYQVAPDMAMTGAGQKPGETKHPMLEEHFIEWITLSTNQGIYRKQLNPGQEPVADFCLDGEQVEEVYAYCNLHGLWKC